MKRLQRSLRITTWLIQSFLKRYKFHLMLAAGIGAVIMVIMWSVFPLVSKQLFPSRTVTGIVGMYRPDELPLSIQNYISAGFTQVEDNGEAVPRAVTKWEVNKEGTRYFFHLKQGIYWHNGTELTAHDVNYNFRDVTIAPADRYTLKIELEDPFSPLPTLLSRPLFKPGLVGIGPYEVVQLELQGDTVEKLILRKSDQEILPVNTTYTTDLIQFNFYPSIEAATLAFKLGEVDHIENISTKIDLADEQNVTVSESMSKTKVLALFFNMTDQYFGSKEFRQALSYATPELEGDRVDSTIPSTSWAYNNSAKKYSYNLDKAKELYKKSNIKDPEITLSVFPEYLDQAEKIAESWRELEVPVNVQVIRSFPPDYQVILGVQDIPSDPDQYQLWHSTQQITNITHYNNPKIDKLLEEGRTLQTKEERLEVYKEFQRYIMEDNPANFLIHPKTYTISRA